MSDKSNHKKFSAPGGTPSSLFSMSQFNPALEWIERWSKAAPQVSSGMQGFGQWIAPTLDPKELEKRISDLRTVQFWLEQNTRLVATTIQALEVQRMTLNALQGMNLPVQAAPEPAGRTAAESVSSAQASANTTQRKPARTKRAGADKAQAGQDMASALSRTGVDAMNWWNAMTEQFGQLATQAMKDVNASKASPHAPSAASSSSTTAAKKTAPRSKKTSARRT